MQVSLAGLLLKRIVRLAGGLVRSKRIVRLRRVAVLGWRRRWIAGLPGILRRLALGLARILRLTGVRICLRLTGELRLSRVYGLRGLPWIYRLRGLTGKLRLTGLIGVLLPGELLQLRRILGLLALQVRILYLAWLSRIGLRELTLSRILTGLRNDLSGLQPGLSRILPRILI